MPYAFLMSKNKGRTCLLAAALTMRANVDVVTATAAIPECSLGFVKIDILLKSEFQQCAKQFAARQTSV